MSYVKTTWEDLPSQNTPITAARLNNIETGVENNDKRLNGTTSMGNVIVEGIRSKNMLGIGNIQSGKYLTTDGTYEAASINCCTINKIEIDNTKNYVFSAASGTNKYIMFYASDNSFLGYKNSSTANVVLNTFNNYSSAKYIQIRFDTEITNFASLNAQLEEGDTATPYSPYQDLNPIGIVESYQGTNDTYIKFADGTMIMTKYVSLNPIAINTASGSMFISAETSLGDWITPFTAKPYYTVSQSSGTSFGCIYYLRDASATSAGKIQLIRTTSHNSANWACSIIAIGRWK